MSTESPCPARHLIDISPHLTIGAFEFEGLTPYPAEYQSYNEKHAILTLALCHDVLEIRTQPERFSYMKSTGKTGSHYPDIQILTSIGSELIEVKAIENLLHPKNITKYSEIAKDFRRNGISYSFLTNAQMEVQPRFKSVMLLQKYLKAEMRDEVADLIIKALCDRDIQIQELIELTGVGLADIYTMIARRRICFDWALSLNPLSRISLPGQPFKGLTYAEVQNSTKFCRLLEELALGRQPSNQHLVAVAKAWRQADSLSGLWGVVGGFVLGSPLRDIDELGFLRSAKHRRAVSPGENLQNGATEGGVSS